MFSRIDVGQQPTPRHWLARAGNTPARIGANPPQIINPVLRAVRWRAVMNASLTNVDGDAGAGGDMTRNTTRSMPVLLTVNDVAVLLRTTRRAVYAMIERRQLPGLVRIGRRVLLRADDLLHWLDQKSAPSPGSKR